MADTATADLTLHDLTLEARAALERAVDGPITSTMIADTLRARPQAPGPQGPAALRRLMAWASADLDFYRAQIRDLESEIAALVANRDGHYSAAENLRRGCHAAALQRQRDGLVGHCAPYEAIIAYARDNGTMAAPENTPGPTCKPSGSRYGLTED